MEGGKPLPTRRVKDSDEEAGQRCTPPMPGADRLPAGRGIDPVPAYAAPGYWGRGVPSSALRFFPIDMMPSFTLKPRFS